MKNVLGQNMKPLPDPVRIECNGIELEVFTEGQGKPLLLCHGWPEHAYSWRHQWRALLDMGYQLIAPNQRGYGLSCCPKDVAAYDINQLTGDICALLDQFGHDKALLVGHDWGAIVAWNMALLHPQRVSGLINFSVPLMRRGEKNWIDFWEEKLGPDFYMVHFSRRPGVADAVFEAHTEQFLRNLYRTDSLTQNQANLSEGMFLINLAMASHSSGNPIMQEHELQVFLQAFTHTGFTPGLNWYRNMSRNWAILADAPEQVHCPTLMIYGARDMVPQDPKLSDKVPLLETATVDCGHWIMQEKPAESTELMINWLHQYYPSR
ncbi:MAG: alpha/beta fold hydrolase [Granulosicoccaceae bacterium]